LTQTNKMGFWNRESKDEKIAKAVTKALNNKTPTRVDQDFARTKEIINMVNSLHQNQPTQSGDFMGKMLEFEKIKTSMNELESARIDKIREQIEQEYDDSDGGLKPEQIFNMLPGLMQKKDPEPRVITPAQVITFPEVPKEERPPLPDLTSMEQKAVSMAVKKIPKIAKTAFKSMSEDKKDAVLNAMMDGIEKDL
jgi:hypothetical protein